MFAWSSNVRILYFCYVSIKLKFCFQHFKLILIYIPCILTSVLTLASTFSGICYHLFFVSWSWFLFSLKSLPFKLRPSASPPSSVHSSSTSSVRTRRTAVSQFMWAAHSSLSPLLSVPLSYYSIFFSFQRSFCLLTSHEICLHVFTVYFFSLPSIIFAVTGACFSFLFASVCWAVGIVLGKLGLSTTFNK